MTGRKHADTEYTYPGRTDPPSYASLESWCRDIHEWAVGKGWWDEGVSKTFTECMMLAVTELAEAVEEFRDGRPCDGVYYVQDDDGHLKPEGIPIEIADVFIRLFDTVAAFGIPLEAAIRDKQLYNRTRGYRHGGKLI